MKGTPAFRTMEDRDETGLIDLWERCGLTRPHNDPVRDIALARHGFASDILIGEVEGKIIASVMVGHDGHRGVVYYVCVDPVHQNKGYGRQVMRNAENWLKDRGVGKLNLLIRPENTEVRAFYEKLGYELEPRLCMARRLSG